MRLRELGSQTVAQLRVAARQFGRRGLHALKWQARGRRSRQVRERVLCVAPQAVISGVRERPFEFRARAVRVAAARVGDPQVVVDDRGARREAQRRSVVGDRTVRVAELQLRVAALEEQTGIVRNEADGRVELWDRAVVRAGRDITLGPPERRQGRV